MSRLAAKPTSFSSLTGTILDAVFFYLFGRAPDTASVKIKTPHAATKDSLKRVLSLSLELQATDLSEVTFTDALRKVPE